VFGVGISGADSRAIIARGCGRGSKAYLPNFSRSLQTELPNNKIVIQAVLLGFVRIEFFDVAGSASSFLEHLFVSAGEPADAALVALDQGELICIPTLAGYDDLHGLRGRQT
jgi:short-subunit dehydrogenase